MFGCTPGALLSQISPDLPQFFDIRANTCFRIGKRGQGVTGAFIVHQSTYIYLDLGSQRWLIRTLVTYWKCC